MSESNGQVAVRTVSSVSTPALVLSAVLLGGGVTAVTVAFAFGMVPGMFDATAINPWLGWALAVVGAAFIASGMWHLSAQVGLLEDEAEQSLIEPERSKRLYGIYLVGVGFALLTQALACSIVFLGVSWSVAERRSGVASPPPVQASVPDAATTASSAAVAPPSKAVAGFERLFGKDAKEAFTIAGMFVLSIMVAILGALFYFANALWQKMDAPERDAFDRRVFWGGLWFRIGEALLFNLVFFLVIRAYAPDQVLTLPLVSLLVGMFLKSGETLVSGIATRVFTAIQALVPPDGARKTTKLLTFKVGGIDSTAAVDDVKKRLDDLAAVLNALAGVTHVESDAKTLVVRVEYDPAAVTADDMKKKVQLKGLQMAPDPGNQ